MKNADPSRIKEYGYLTIKERLLYRFHFSRSLMGKNWRGKLLKADPFFDTKKGQDFITSTVQACSQPKRGQVDRIERVVVAMEKVLRIEIV